METFIYNLTENEAGALLHWENGQSQEWAMVRLDDRETLSRQVSWSMYHGVLVNACDSKVVGIAFVFTVPMAENIVVTTYPAKLR